MGYLDYKYYNSLPDHVREIVDQYLDLLIWEEYHKPNMTRIIRILKNLERRKEHIIENKEDYMSDDPHILDTDISLTDISLAYTLDNLLGDETILYECGKCGEWASRTDYVENKSCRCADGIITKYTQDKCMLEFPIIFCNNPNDWRPGKFRKAKFEGHPHWLEVNAYSDYTYSCIKACSVCGMDALDGAKFKYEQHIASGGKADNTLFAQFRREWPLTAYTCNQCCINNWQGEKTRCTGFDVCGECVKKAVYDEWPYP